MLAVLLPKRCPQSVFAGGSVLNRHAYRLSDDQDLFHAEGIDVHEVAKTDMDALEQAGYHVTVTKQYEGFIEVRVGHEEMGTTKIQWVEAGSWTFFVPVPDPDPEYGFRLHMLDLAINKALAAGGRHEVRDFIDLALIHQHIMPLWQAIWAAPGKDAQWSPLSLAERIGRNNNFRQEDYDDAEIISLIDLSAAEIGATVREAIEEARHLFELLPPGTAGHLLLDANGHFASLDAIINGGDVRTLPAKRGGAWPSSPDIDHFFIDRLIQLFGRDGEKLTEIDAIEPETDHPARKW
ncbi:MAG: hypothetical protein K2Q10_06325 [Rhodospirillales bacterium]|nr:hypothetical protein [Rhodospirillales bacterium]